MTRDNRQILINPHSSQEKVPVGALNLGEIAVQHNNVDDAALYVETVADSESASTVAKFITEKAIEARIDDAIDTVQLEIDGINEAVGLPHDPEMWDSGMSVWDAIEHTYQEMTAGTAAANTKLELVGGSDDYLDLTAVKDDATSSVTYYLSSKGIDERVESAYTIVTEKVTELSAATETLIESAYTILTEKITELSGAVESFSSATVERIETVENNLEELSGSTEEAIADLQDQIEELEEEINANEVSSEDGSIVVTSTSGGTDLKVNIDEATVVLNDNNELVADLKLTSVTPSDVNVKEEFALVDHNGRQLGETVKVYKDSSLYSADLGHVDDVLSDPDDPTSLVVGSGDTALDLIYHKEDGTYELVTIDVNDFLEESEFQDGLEVDNHVVKVKVDDESEEVEVASGVTAPVLSVSEDGVKIANIQAAINYAVETLAHNVDADVTGESEDGHVSVEVVQTDTEISQVVVTTEDIASEDELKTVEESVGLGENGEFETIEGNYTSAATSVIGGIQAIDLALKEVSDKLNNASVIETGSTENWVTLTVEEVEDGVTGLTLDDSALAEELLDIRADLEAETSAREDADDVLLGSEEISTSADTSIWGIKKLLANLTTTIVKDVTVTSAETLLAVAKEDTPEGDLYTVSSTERLNEAVEAAEKAVVNVEFAEVSDERTFVAEESGVGAAIDGEENDKTLKLDFSVLRIDCGQY